MNDINSIRLFDFLKKFGKKDLEELGLGKVCSDQTIDNRLKLMNDFYPNWTILRGSENDNLTANKVASRFLVLYREG